MTQPGKSPEDKAEFKPRSATHDLHQICRGCSFASLHFVHPLQDVAPHQCRPLRFPEEVVTHISQQVTEMSADIQALKNSDVQQTHDIRDALTSTFIRWGSSTCDDSSELVYSGVVGGSHPSHTGAAANYLCLTVTARVWCRGGIDRKRNSTINLTTDSGACY